MSFDLIDLILQAGLIVKLVLLVLFAFSLSSLTIIVVKWWELRVADQDSEAFLEAAAPRPRLPRDRRLDGAVHRPLRNRRRHHRRFSVHRRSRTGVARRRRSGHRRGAGRDRRRSARGDSRDHRVQRLRRSHRRSARDARTLHGAVRRGRREDRPDERGAGFGARPRTGLRRSDGGPALEDGRSQGER